MSQYILAIDQGTTSSRAIIFDTDGTPVGTDQQEFPQYFPADGWVEHDADEIWESVLHVVRAAIESADIAASDIRVAGITNQRETTVLWDRDTGTPIGKAIVWQDRRTAEYCQSLKDDGFEDVFRAKTGLLLDPYFSATKVRWMLDHIDGAREAAEAGRLAFGTIDCFLIWRLTGGAAHRTDATNAARTGLFNIHTQDWDEDILGSIEHPKITLARGDGLECRLRRHWARPRWTCDSDWRCCGRSTGCLNRSGMLPRGHDEKHVWDGLFHDFEHREQTAHVESCALNNGRLSPQR